MSDSNTAFPATRPPLGCAALLMEVLRGELRERELPFTHQREAIARVLFESPRNFSADEVAEELRERGEQSGKATIYRTLALLWSSALPPSTISMRASSDIRYRSERPDTTT